ncbi:DUF262 domain-containing protein [Arthrobacter sp. B2a2-09]|uniref:DUF262 domain-containing protein n=1 Tax=Arthrobacter sp. B2a2-09 TaxID=2952822 RepID=UPI0022CD6220|nr:DUF262 domain-containing protein [Arthrobacter sp. B2a2-09]MCZ9882019.1 DUF262 domain-containing protein [Arthrobacter sp. B2a2-09]
MGTIIDLARSGQMRIPHFQRSFVWDAGDVVKLFDSIYRGFPIGTLLLWKKPVKKDRAQFGPIWIDAEAHNGGLIVVDGQQRVTTLIASLVRDFALQDPRFQIFFDIEKRRFSGLINGRQPSRSVPVTEILSSKALLSWLRENGDDLTDEDLDIVDDLGGTIRDYKVPVYVVPEQDESVLREVFDRVNSAGRPITRSQIFHALFAGSDEWASPRAVVDSIAALGFGQVDENRVLQTLLGIRGGDVMRDIHAEFRSDESPDEWYQKAEDALTRAVDFMRGIGVPHALLLPNTLPLPVLAVFLHRHPELDPWNARLLETWIWRSWIFGIGTGTGGQTPILRKAISLISPRTHGSPSQLDAYQDLLSLYGLLDKAGMRSIEEEKFATDKASSRLVLLAMADLSPVDPHGRPIDIGDLLNRYGTGAVGSLTAGPRQDVGNRSFWLKEWGDVRAMQSPVDLQSHFLTIDDIHGDDPAMIEARRLRIRAHAEKFLAVRVDEGLSLRPPLSSLLVAD